MIGGILEIARKNAPLALDAAGEPILNSDGLPVHNISLLWQILIFNFTSLMQGLAWPASGEHPSCRVYNSSAPCASFSRSL